MRTVLKTYSPVQLNFAQTLLKQAGIKTVVVDGTGNVIEVVEGLVFELMVLADEDAERAQQIMRDGMPEFADGDDMT